MLQVCTKLFGYWNTDVRYCHWKSNEHLMEGLDGETDLDVFVYPDDKSIAETHLRSCNYIKFVPQKSSRYPMVDEWIGFDRGTGKLVHVHLHYQIITGTKFCKEYIIPINEEIIESRVLDKETQVYVSSPELELIVLYSRIVLKSTNKNKISTRGYEAEIIYLKNRINYDALKKKCTSIIGADGKLFYDLISSDISKQQDWKKLEGVIHIWLDKYRKMSSLSVLLRTNYYWAKYYKDILFVRYLHRPVLAKKTFPNSKMSICFLGQDGSGKSTLSQNIEKWLRWKIEAHRFYLGSGEHYKSMTKWLLTKAAHLRKQGSVNNIISKKNQDNEYNNGRKKGLIPMLVAILSSHDMKNVAKRAYIQIKSANGYSQKGAISLFDRFPQNQFYGIYDGPKIRSVYLEKGFDNFIIKRYALREEYYLNKIQKYQPSIVFKLLLSPEESIKRKPFENYEQICQKHEITKKLAFSNSEVHVIDATQEYEKELLMVKNIIWDFFLKNL